MEGQGEAWTAPTARFNLWSRLQYRVGTSAVKAKLQERATLAHFVVVRPVTGHSCSAGDGAWHDVLGFLTLHRDRPQ